MSSFNWKNEDNTNDPKYSNHLANLVRQTIIITIQTIFIVIIAVIMTIIAVTLIKNKDYAACVRRESGYCEVEWTTATPYDQQVTNVNFLSNRHFLMIRVAVVMIAMITDNHQ